MVDSPAVGMPLNPKIVTNSHANGIVLGHLLLNGLHAVNLVEPEHRQDLESSFNLLLMVDMTAKD